MKFVIARMSHETNTFSPVPTSWERFADGAGNSGAAAIEAYQGTNTPIAAYIDLAREVGAEIEIPIAAGANPSGPVAAQAYEFMVDAILEAIGRGCDAVMLDLHGAMVAETTPDGEGTLLRRIRGIAPEVPMCVTCDLHANLTQDMAGNCNALIGYKTYPHIDTYDVGHQVGRVLLDQIAGKVNPVMAWGRRDMLPHTLCMGHEFEPMKTLQEMARAAERSGMLAASVFGGFPLADIEAAGLSAVVVADGDPDAARAVVERPAGCGLGAARRICLPGAAPGRGGRARQADGGRPHRAAGPRGQLCFRRYPGRDGGDRRGVAPGTRRRGRRCCLGPCCRSRDGQDGRWHNGHALLGREKRHPFAGLEG